MLPVVHLQPLALERVRRAAEPAPDLDQRHLRAGLRAVERGGDAGQAATDNHDAPHAATPSIPRTATIAFSCAGSDTRPDSTAAGSESMRSSSRR